MMDAENFFWCERAACRGQVSSRDMLTMGRGEKEGQSVWVVHVDSNVITCRE